MKRAAMLQQQQQQQQQKSRDGSDDSTNSSFSPSSSSTSLDRRMATITASCDTEKRAMELCVGRAVVSAVAPAAADSEQ